MLIGRAALVVALLCSGACFAQAASLPDSNAFSATPAEQETTDWKGFYLHGNGGFGSDSLSWGNINVGTAAAGFSTAGTRAGSGQNFGYNIQSGNFVVGLEGSFAAANFDGRFTSPSIPAVGGWTPNMNWMGTVTGRIGYAFDRWLPYVKGGFATADVSSPLQDGAFTQGTTQTGWTAGVGLEYQLSSKWSLGLEYLYTDLGAAPGPQGGIAAGGGPEVYSTAVKTQSLLGRLNYKTGW